MGDVSNVVTVRFPGATLDVDLAALDGADWRDMKRATGLHDLQVVDDAVQWGDRDATAALAWVWMRRDAPELTFDAVLHFTHYGPAPVADDDDEPEPEPVPAAKVEPVDPFADIEERMAEARAAFADEGVLTNG